MFPAPGPFRAISPTEKIRTLLQASWPVIDGSFVVPELT